MKIPVMKIRILKRRVKNAWLVYGIVEKEVSVQEIKQEIMISVNNTLNVENMVELMKILIGIYLLKIQKCYINNTFEHSFIKPKDIEKYIFWKSTQ